MELASRLTRKQASAHTWAVCPSARPATSAAGSAPATVPTTTSRAASGKDPRPSTSRSRRTTSPRTASWSSVKSDGNTRGINMDKDKRWGWCISVQYGVWVKQKRAPQGFRLQRPLIDHKPRSKPDCCLSLGKFLLSLTLDLVRWPMPIVQKDKVTGNAPASPRAQTSPSVQHGGSVTRAISWFGHVHRTLMTQGK